ncbi:helix-turn-helix domain-containing protein [Salisaeta longa]|uniref:helix-turn-helix domain-containing protein n=1 Tax=Salisaeta longa TaxID=503170 RepID=UPI00042071E2|nr:helix-turn-helix transcriptional regulator [Salisaeta longa]
MMTSNPSFAVSEARIDKRATRLTHAIAERIRDAMGNMTQRALAEDLGYRSGSTVSAHLNGRTNLTLKTVVRYAVALDADIVFVPNVKRPKKRRRRGGKRTISKERKALADIDPVKRKLHRLLTDLTARIGQIIEADNELSQRELARRMDRDEAYVSRGLAGGINFTLKTIAAFEEALGTRLLAVAGNGANGSSTTHKQGAFVPQVQASSDGGYCKDTSGTATRAVTFSDYLIRKEQTATEDEELQAA